MQVYQLIFNNNYDFNIASKQLSLIIERIKELIFILYSNDKVYPIIIIDSNYKELFNNILTLEEFELDNSIFNKRLYAKLRYKHHYAIPFTITLEPFLLYKVLADYNDIVFIMHINQYNERYSIANYLKKHELKKSSIYYTYNDHIRHKLQSIHYHSILLLASNNKDYLMKGLSVFKSQHFRYSITSNKLYKFSKPKKPLLFNDNYTVLSNIEIVSLMLPEVLLRVSIDGIRPYTTGLIL